MSRIPGRKGGERALTSCRRPPRTLGDWCGEREGDRSRADRDQPVQARHGRASRSAGRLDGCQTMPCVERVEEQAREHAVASPRHCAASPRPGRATDNALRPIHRRRPPHGSEPPCGEDQPERSPPAPARSSRHTGAAPLLGRGRRGGLRVPHTHSPVDDDIFLLRPRGRLDAPIACKTAIPEMGENAPAAFEHGEGRARRRRRTNKPPSSGPARAKPPSGGRTWSSGASAVRGPAWEGRDHRLERRREGGPYRATSTTSSHS